MKNTKIIQLLSTFSPAEFNDFGKFLNSPFHNESSKVVNLYNFLKKYYPGFSHKDLTKENAFIKIYGKENPAYDDKKLRERFSDMLKLAEEYLAYVEIKSSPVKYKNQTLIQFRKRNLTVHFDKKDKEIRTVLDRTEIKNYDFFYDEYLHYQELRSINEYKKLLGKRNNEYESLNEEIELFLRFFTSRMLQYYAVMYNREDHMNDTFEYKFYDEVARLINEYNFEKFPYIRVYNLVLKLRNSDEDEKAYFELKRAYIENHNFLEQDDRNSVNVILYNWAQKKFLKEVKGFDTELFDIIKRMLENGIYLTEDGWMSREQYINCVFVPVALGQLEWAEKFIANYTIKVAPDKRDDAFLYVSGLLHTAQKKYDTALSQLAKIKGGDYVYYVRIKILQSKIYFEQKDFEKVLILIDSFKHYVSSNPSIPAVSVKRYNNYSNVLHKLVMLSMDKDEYKVSKLIEEIKNSTIDELTSNKSWLLEKAVELI